MVKILFNKKIIGLNVYDWIGVCFLMKSKE